MNQKYLYIGFFIEPESFSALVGRVRRSPLPCPVLRPHVTLCFKPGEVDSMLFGEKAKITAVGYGNDGENEGLLVTVEPENDRLRQMAAELAVPHITIATSETGKPVNTAKLRFEPIEPIVMSGIFGGETARK